LTQLARPVLQSLSDRVGETSHLGTLVGSEVVHLDASLPDQLVLTGSRVGHRLPSHCTALGKVLLAGQESVQAQPADAEALGKAAPSLEMFTESTIVDRTKLSEALRTARIQGYAVDTEEYASGLCCVAAPVVDDEGVVLAALSLSGPSFRMSESELHGAARDRIMESATELSRLLGGAA
jgi:DNA-binding IclR family transcriptional regulator